MPGPGRATSVIARARGEISSRSIDLFIVTVAAEATFEPRGTCGAIFDQCFAAVVPLLYHRVANREAMAFDCGAPVRSDAYGWKARNSLGEFFCLRAHLTVWHEVFAESDSEAFLSWNLATGQDDIERPALAHDAGQAHRTAIN